MKALKQCVVIVGVFLLLGLSVTNVKAEYLGELCWNMVINGGTYGPTKFGITHMGGNHYLIQGGWSENNMYLSGSGLLVGNKMIFSMSGTQTQNGPKRFLKGGDSWEVTIDLTTLNGPFWHISTEYFEDGTSNVHYDEGTFEFTSCQ